MDDPESAAGNSSGSFEELFRSFGTLGRGQPSEGWSEGLSELSPLSSRRPVRVAFMSIITSTEARISAGFVGEEGVEPSVQIIAARCSLLSRSGGQGSRLSNKHSITIVKTTACGPVHRLFVSFVVYIIGQFSGSVAASADVVHPGVESCASAVRADDWVVIVHGFCLFRCLFYQATWRSS